MLLLFSISISLDRSLHTTVSEGQELDCNSGSHVLIPVSTGVSKKIECAPGILLAQITPQPSMSPPQQYWWCKKEANTEFPSLFQFTVWKGGKLVTLCYLRALAAWVSHIGLKGDPLHFCLLQKCTGELWFYAGRPKVWEGFRNLCSSLGCGYLSAPCACGDLAGVTLPKGCLPGRGQTALQTLSAGPSSFLFLHSIV